MGGPEDKRIIVEFLVAFVRTFHSCSFDDFPFFCSLAMGVLLY